MPLCKLGRWLGHSKLAPFAMSNLETCPFCAETTHIAKLLLFHSSLHVSRLLVALSCIALNEDYTCRAELLQAGCGGGNGVGRSLIDLNLQLHGTVQGRVKHSRFSNQVHKLLIDLGLILLICSPLSCSSMELQSNACDGLGNTKSFKWLSQHATS